MMESGNAGKFEVTTLTQQKSDQRSFGRRTIIFAILVLVVLLIIVAVSLGVVLSQDGDSDSQATNKARYPIILISADGFRADYLTRGLTPNIAKLGDNGVRAKFLLSQFPTKTFPNHYSIVTGLYPESHGIVFNSFYDPVLKRRFSIPTSRDPVFWRSGEPIWITAKKNGLKSASYYWVGAEVRGMRTTYYRVYNQSVPFSDRVKQVLEWLQLPEKERPSIVFLYFHEPDYVGHAYGTNAPAVRKQIRLVDDSIGQLMTGLENMNKSDEVNVILVSDHGMSNVNCNKTIFLDKYGVKANELFISNAGAVLSFVTKRRRNLENVFSMIKCRNESFQSFYKRNLPKRMHFSNNRRIDDIIVLVDQRNLISVNSSERTRCLRGSHGFDNILSDMHPIFLARGPSFQNRKVVEHFSNIEIYNLLASLLRINPASNNGTIGSLNSLLVPEARSPIPESQSDGSVFQADNCKFPNDKEFEVRSDCCICVSCHISQENITEANKIFNITAEEGIEGVLTLTSFYEILQLRRFLTSCYPVRMILYQLVLASNDVDLSRRNGEYYQKEHSPWGLPQKSLGEKACLLTQPNFITGYSTFLRIPVWTAITLTGRNLVQSNTEIEDCHRRDVRLTENELASCASYKNTSFDQGQLLSSRDLSFNKTAMLSASTFANIVPIYPIFKKGIWERLENSTRNWAIKYKRIHVLSGTIFDVDADGIGDQKISVKRRVNQLPENPAIPTHFYKIVARCESDSTSDNNLKNCSGTIHVISFILRHTNEDCKLHSYDKLLIQNVARIRDVELLTGLNFFSELPKQLQAELKTFVPVGMWS